MDTFRDVEDRGNPLHRGIPHNTGRVVLWSAAGLDDCSSDVVGPSASEVRPRLFVERRVAHNHACQCQPCNAATTKSMARRFSKHLVSARGCCDNKRTTVHFRISERLHAIAAVRGHVVQQFAKDASRISCVQNMQIRHQGIDKTGHQTSQHQVFKLIANSHDTMHQWYRAAGAWPTSHCPKMAGCRSGSHSCACILEQQRRMT